ncbi:hypothetical protein G5I_00012 [Acromyrmex echinatior]|uniref:Uncharacterized protein n=1 Tax=Acromyrmex echinatior TaxID=103372 RepID=F4W3R5_ACREC|nr:hypothetical protein G5I_00012 [Acromyrmex echinatior]
MYDDIRDLGGWSVDLKSGVETQTGSSLGYDDLTDDLNRYRGNRSAHGQLPILSHGNHRGGSDLIAACWLGAFGPNG